MSECFNKSERPSAQLGFFMIIIGGIIIANYFGVPAPSISLIVGTLLVVYGFGRVIAAFRN